MADGIVLRGIGGFYTVRNDASGETVECRPRGRLKLGKSILPGDRVRWEAPDQGETYGTIESIYPRRTELARPPVANANLAIVVDSVARPKPNPLLVDRILALAQYAGLDVALCLNKVDLADDRHTLAGRLSPYESAGMRVIPTSAKRGDGMSELRALLSGRVSTFAGPSGVGKSSLLNAMVPAATLQTGTISQKSERGRHTTRHTELIPLPTGGFVADTPGFHQLSVRAIPKEELGDLFLEIARRAAGCRFSGCLHFKEPDCAVRTAASEGDIPAQRFENYTKLLQEILEYEERRWR